MWIIKNRPTPTPTITSTPVYAVKRQRAVGFNKYSIDEYKDPAKKDMAVCLAFFSPVNSKRLLNNYIKIKKSLNDARIPNYTIELKLNNKSFISDAYLSLDSSSIMFYKENLWNILAEKISKKYKKLCFLDCDITFSDMDWYEKTSELLEESDIVQPFENAIWLDEQDAEVQRNPCVAQFIGFGNKLDFSNSHPGFSWAVNRKIFDKINGFYQDHVLGAGDAFFAMALNHSKLKPSSYGYHKDLVDSYNNYLKNIKKCKIKVDYLEGCDAIHSYHGKLENRNYTKAEVKNIKLIKDNFGLLQWEDIKNNQAVLEMFRNRKEDD